MQSVIDILEQLESNNSRLFKEELLEAQSGNDLLKRVFVAVGDPYINYYVNKFKSTYFYVPSVSVQDKYPEFPEDKVWYEEIMFKLAAKRVGEFDCLLIDGPKGYKGGFYYNRNSLDLSKKLILVNSVHDAWNLKLLELLAKDLNKPFEVIEDRFNKKVGFIRP